MGGSYGEALVPRRSAVSNRSVINRLREWGAHGEKVRNDVTSMVLPGGETVEVISAHAHRRNGSNHWDAILTALNTSYEGFWMTDLAPPDKELIESFDKIMDSARETEGEMEAAERAAQEERDRTEAEKQEQRRQRRQQRAAESRRQKEENRVQQLAASTAPVDPSESVEGLPRQKRQHIINQVFDVLIRTGEPMSFKRICEVLNDPDVTESRVSSACSGLWRNGVAIRIKRGVYQAHPEHQRQDVRVGVQGRVNGLEHAEETAAASVPVTERVRQVPRIPIGEDDQTINDLLDLMFPDGFKARHLAAIDTWRQATVALMHEIEADRAGRE